MKQLWLVGGLLAATSVAGAQGLSSPSPSCPAGAALTAQNAVQDACQKSLDLVSYLAPQLATSIAGGNTTLGQGGALGGGFMGIPHFSIGLRATGILGSVPNINNVTPSTTGAVASNYTTSSTILPFPAVDAAIGVFSGYPLPMTHIGAVDLLLSAAYVPSVTTNNVSVKPNSSLNIGYGLRVGLLQEGLLTPGVAVSYIHRGLPTTTITATPSGTDTLQLQNIKLGTNSYRLTVGKNLILLGLAAGVGMDQYSTSGAVYASVPVPTAIISSGRATTNPSFSQSVTRTNAFVDASMNLVILNIIAEGGYVSGGTINTYNIYDKAPNAARPYLALGVRVGI